MSPTPIRFTGLLFLRASGDAVLWLKRHVLWELALVLTSAAAGALFSPPGHRPGELFAYSLASGLIAIGALLAVVWTYYLVRAPRMLRERQHRRYRQPVFHFWGRVRAPATKLSAEAFALINEMEKLCNSRNKLSDRGSSNEASLDRQYRKVLAAVERFGGQIADSGPEDTTPSERRRAYRLYEDLRGFPLHGELEFLAGRVREFSIRTAPLHQRLGDQVRARTRRLWYRVS